jgi:hypothetical protein
MTFEQAATGSHRFVLMAVLFPVVIALLYPFLMVGVHISSDPAARAVVAERPLIAVELMTGLAALGAIFGWPLVKLALSVIAQRRIEIADGLVTTAERGILGAHTWTEPLSAYVGLAHRVRTSISGVSHELVLVHPQAARSIVIGVAPRLTQEDLEDAARLFGLAEIPSRAPVSVPSSRALSKPAEA